MSTGTSRRICPTTVASARTSRTGTTGELLAALKDHLTTAAADLGPAARVDVPPPSELRLAQVSLPRDAFLGPTQDVPVSAAAGRVAAEMINIPDPSDPQLDTVRVVAER